LRRYNRSRNTSTRPSAGYCIWALSKFNGLKTLQTITLKNQDFEAAAHQRSTPKPYLLKTLRKKTGGGVWSILTPMRNQILAAALLIPVAATAQKAALQQKSEAKSTVLHAAHLLDVAAGKLISPGEVLVTGNRITEAGEHVAHPPGAETIDLGTATLMPGLIDAHVHLFLHPGNEAFQTVLESVPQRTLIAASAA